MNVLLSISSEDSELALQGVGQIKGEAPNEQDFITDLIRDIMLLVDSGLGSYQYAILANVTKSSLK